LSRGFKAFLVASALFLWFLVEWQRGPGGATGAVAIVALVVVLTVLAAGAAVLIGIMVHELGHALAAVALTPGRPLVEIGAPPRRLRLSLGRIDVHLGLRPGAGCCLLPRDGLTRSRDALVASAGPLASALVAGFWVGVATRSSERLIVHLAFLAAVLEGLRAMKNLIPGEIEHADELGNTHTYLNDGGRILAALRHKPLAP
jgi:hypothetical protein